MPRRRTVLAPRKRPRQARAIATVEAILEAAARILETAGLDALNTNAVAARAGVSVGSLYQYFPTRDAIVAELARRQQAALLAALERALDRPASTLAVAVRRLVAVAVDAQLRRPELARALDYAESLLPPDAELDALNGRIGATVAGVLRAHGHGPAALEVATRDVVALVRGMVDAAGRAGERNPAPLVARVSRAVLGYLGVAGERLPRRRTRPRLTAPAARSRSAP